MAQQTVMHTYLDEPRVTKDPTLAEIASSSRDFLLTNQTLEATI